MKLKHVALAVAALGLAAAIYHHAGRNAAADKRLAAAAAGEQAGRRTAAAAVGGGSGTQAAVRPEAAASGVRAEGGSAERVEEQAAGKVLLQIVLPKPQFAGTPKDARAANLEPDRNGKARPLLALPAGCDKVLSRGCRVTSSDPVPVIGEIAFITDGDKEHDMGTYVELGPGVQWVQLDLGQERELFAACVWHFHGEARVYNDVVCQISNDAVFSNGVTTVFNNDHDNSSKLGTGSDKEYIETFEGRPFAVNGVKGRYVRFYSKGNTSNEMNHYTEVEVYGRE